MFVNITPFLSVAADRPWCLQTHPAAAWPGAWGSAAVAPGWGTEKERAVVKGRVAMLGLLRLILT